MHEMIGGHRIQVDGRSKEFKEKLGLRVSELTRVLDEIVVLGEQNKGYQ